MSNIKIPALTLLGLFVFTLILFGDDMNHNHALGAIVFCAGISIVVLNIFIFSSLPYRDIEGVRFQYRMGQIFAFIGMFIFPLLVYFYFGRNTNGLNVIEAVIFMIFFFFSIFGSATPWLYSFSKKIYEVNRARK